MSMTKKRKKNKLIYTLILLGALTVFAGGALYNGGVAIKKPDSLEVLGKLKNIQEKGGKFELNQKEVDEVSSLYFAKPKSKGDMTLKGVNIEIVNDELLIKAPVSYKNLDLIVSSKGKLNYSSGEIVFDADSFKIGMIRIPKNLVVAQASKFKNQDIYAQGNLIKINPSLLPFKIEDIEITDNKILGTAEKPDIKDVASDSSKVPEEEKAEEETPNEQTASESAALKETESDLGAAKAQVETPKEQQVISKMLSTVSKMEADPSYDPTGDQAAVKADYNTLDSESQDRVKVALISNVDPGNVELLRQTFGM